MRSKFTDEQRAAIVRDYLAGIPIRTIALNHGCAESYPSMLARRRARPKARCSGRLCAEAIIRGWKRAREVGPVIA